MRFSRESFLPWPVSSTPFVSFDRVGILGDLSLLVDPAVVANAAIVPLALSILHRGLSPLAFRMVRIFRPCRFPVLGRAISPAGIHVLGRAVPPAGIRYSVFRRAVWFR